MNPNTASRSPAGIVILTVLLSILLCAALVAAVVLAGLHAQLSEDGIDSLAEGIDPYNATKRALASEDLLPEEWIAGLVNPARRSKMHITEEGLRKMAESSYFRSFLSTLIGDYLNDFRHETGEGRIGTKDVMKVIRHYEKDILKYFGYPISEEDYTDIENFLNSVDLESFDFDVIRSNNPEAVRTAQIVLSGPVLWGIVAAAVLLAVVILTANLHYPWNWLAGIGASLLAAGILLLILRGGVQIAVSFIPTQWRSVGFMALQALGVLLSWILRPGVAMSAVGLAMCIAGSAVRSKKRRTEAAHTITYA